MTILDLLQNFTANSQIAAGVAIICAMLYESERLRGSSKHFKMAFAVLLGGLIGVVVLTDPKDLSTALGALQTGLASGVAATGSVKLVSYLAGKTKDDPIKWTISSDVEEPRDRLAELDV